MRWFRHLMGKLFHLPGPVELGWSEHDALGMREFTPFQEGKTWEDWEEHVKRLHPVRFFFARTLPDSVAPIGWKLGRAWYWIKCHTLPSHRFHLLDLRKADPVHPYTHGYRDPCSIVEAASWLALRMYLDEEPVDPASWATPKELAEPHLARQKADYDEAVALWKWWSEGRREEEAREGELFRTVQAAKEAKDREAYEAASKPWLEYHRWREEHAEEMLLRLFKIRRTLWT